MIGCLACYVTFSFGDQFEMVGRFTVFLIPMCANMDMCISHKRERSSYITFGWRATGDITSDASMARYGRTSDDWFGWMGPLSIS